MSSSDQFEALLKEQLDNNIISPKQMDEIILKKSEPLKAAKNATLSDFVAMVGKLVTKTMDGVVFMEDEGARIIVDPSKKIESPHIFYTVISREPKSELKPREREHFMERSGDETSDRFGKVLGQKFACVIQFNILAPQSVNRAIDTVMTDFEDMMLAYAHYFKKNGVAELYFKRHFTDNNLDTFRQIVSIRSLQYHVEIERLTLVYEGEIEDLNIQ